MSAPLRVRLTRELPQYLREEARADAVAGLTVAVMGVPQAMAYAIIADLPPVYGLYTAVISSTVAALLGSSAHLVTGPTNASCMVLLSLSAPIVAERGGGPLEIVLLITFLAGLVQLALGMLRLGGLVRYVSNSVMVGFTAGAGVLIATNQLKNILGLDIPADEAGRFLEALAATARELPHTNPRELAVGVLTGVIVMGAPRVHHKIPGALAGVVVAAAVVWGLGWDRVTLADAGVHVVRDIEPIRGNLLEMAHLPALLIRPDLDLIGRLAPGALALAILGLIEATSIARVVASSSGQRLGFSRQFAAQGTANLVGPFFSCFVASGSFTRTMVCYRSGGRTRMAAVFSAVWTAATVALLAPLANHIPRSALAGMLIVIAYSMIDKHRLKLTWRSRASSRLVLFGTLGATLVLPLEYAIFVGVGLSVLNLLRMTGKVDLTNLVPRPDGGFDEVPFNRAPVSPVVTINIAGDLYFAAVEDLDYELLRTLHPETRVVVLRMKRLRAVGSSAMAILEHFWDLLRARGIRLVVCGIEGELQRVMTTSGLRSRIGEQNIFYADNKLLQSTELAQARAWSIVNEARRLEPGRATEGPVTYAGVTAGDILSDRVIRFGNRHQVREAVWLLSEMQKRLGWETPSALFLQDRDGKLWGELSMRTLLHEMNRDLEVDPLRGRSDAELRLLLRRPFAQTIDGIARQDLCRVTRDTRLGELIVRAVQDDLAIMPVVQEDGRVIGQIEPAQLLRGVARALGVEQPDGEPGGRR
ncbi:MAG TPA: SulP family inorganic anion transporter [bacterium]|nr:SulP family inorganic anion transporter [bacterium]